MIEYKINEEVTSKQVASLERIEKLVDNIILDINRDVNFMHLITEANLSLENNSLGEYLKIRSNSAFDIDKSFDVVNYLRDKLFGTLIKDETNKEWDIRAYLKSLIPDMTLVIALNFKVKSQKQMAIEKKIMEEKKQKDENKKTAQGESIVEFTAVTGKFTFDQVVLPQTTLDEINDALRSIECKDLIYNQWGFGEIEPAPRSILNFYGPSGTGKTMCAHAIAKKMNMPLLALKYSEIESKYLGEATKN